jgi:hypothetical protein
VILRDLNDGEEKDPIPYDKVNYGEHTVQSTKRHSVCVFVYLFIYSFVYLLLIQQRCQ